MIVPMLKQTRRADNPPAAAPANQSAPQPSRAAPRAEIKHSCAIGRDPVTPELVDHVGLWFRPQHLWARSLESTRQRATDPGFVGRIDRLANEVLGKPADTLTLIHEARVYHVGNDDAELKASLFRHANPPKGSVTIEGVVSNQSTGQPVSGAEVYTNDVLVRTTSAGRFFLKAVPSGETRIRLWIQAEGYAFGDVSVDVGKPVELVVGLSPELPFVGKVVDPEGRPVGGAVVRARADRALHHPQSTSPKHAQA